MPELPEVEHARRLLQRHVVGKVVRSVVAQVQDGIVFEESARRIAEEMTGRRLLAAKRKGKHLWLEMDRKPCPVFHLGMTGAFFVRGVQRVQYVNTRGGAEDDWPPKFCKFLMEMDDGTETSFTDPRRFARIRMFDKPLETSPLLELGFDALNELPDSDAFAKLIGTRGRSVLKSLLLDQTFAAGVGNWVADESYLGLEDRTVIPSLQVLYHARFHPERKVASMSAAEQERLRTSIRDVVRTAVDCDADSDKYPANWLFHSRWGKGRGAKRPKRGKRRAADGDADSSADQVSSAEREDRSDKPTTAEGYTVEFITVGGRTSAFVPELLDGDSTRFGAAEGETDPVRARRRRGKHSVDPGSDVARMEDDAASGRVAKGAAKRTRKKATEPEEDGEEGTGEETVPTEPPATRRRSSRLLGRGGRDEEASSDVRKSVQRAATKRGSSRPKREPRLLEELEKPDMTDRQHSRRRALRCRSSDPAESVDSPRIGDHKEDEDEDDKDEEEDEKIEDKKVEDEDEKVEDESAKVEDEGVEVEAEGVKVNAESVKVEHEDVKDGDDAENDLSIDEMEDGKEGNRDREYEAQGSFDEEDDSEEQEEPAAEEDLELEEDGERREGQSSSRTKASKGRLKGPTRVERARAQKLAMVRAESEVIFRLLSGAPPRGAAGAKREGASSSSQKASDPGVITAEKLVQAVEEAGQELSIARARDMITMFDRSGLGCLTRDDFDTVIEHAGL